MLFLVENVNDFQFNNEVLQLIALICSLLTNVSLLAIPLIVKQREESISGFKSKISHYEIIEEKLESCLDELRGIKIICESTESSSEVFSPLAEKAEMASYYQRIIYQIQDLTVKALENNSHANSQKQK